MTTTRRPVADDDASLRRAPGRPPIPVDRIVATALRIVDEQGAAALSMRTLAQRLDSGTATLYRHFANRAALVAQVVDRVFAEIEFDTDELTEVSWQQACLAFAHTMFDTLRRHKNVTPLLVEQVPIGPHTMAYRERWIALLLDNGFSPQLAARSYTALARYVLGFAIQLNDDSTAGDLEDTQLAAVFQGLDPTLFPATVAVAKTLPVALGDEFAFGLELIVNGLSQLSEHQKRPRKPQARQRVSGRSR